MTDKRNEAIEAQLKEAVTKMTPDIFDSILADCKKPDKEGVVIKMTNKKNSMTKKIVAVVAALAIVLGGTFGFQSMSANAFAASVSLDVNPSVEIKVNKNDRVIDITAKNEDGQKIIGDMDFKGSDIEVAVSALIGSMLQNGYLSELQNSILVSVDGKDSAKTTELQTEIDAQIAEILKGQNFESAVVSQTIKTNEAIEKIAADYGITKGKAKLINDLVTKDNTLKVEELAGLTINELTLMLESPTRAVETVKVTGKASDKAYIGYEKAKSIALKAAGLAESAIRDLDIEFDHEHGLMLYEVEFDANGYDYEYDINAATGEIVWSTNHVEDDWNDDDHYDDWDDIYDDYEDWKNGTEIAPSESDIGSAKAKEIAFNHAGVAASNAYEIECDPDVDDGLRHYEVEFKSGGYEYSYDIKAADGSILEFDKDRD